MKRSCLTVALAASASQGQGGLLITAKLSQGAGLQHRWSARALESVSGQLGSASPSRRPRRGSAKVEA